MKNLPFLKFFFSVSVFIIFGSCQKAIPPTPSVNPNSIKFAGTLALRSEIEFVEQFPYRSSGSSKSLQAVDWLFSKFSSYGLYCETDTWEIVNYSQLVRLKNLICTLPGENQKEIVIIAHHDQSPATIQGADNDGSGIAIMLQLARIFSSEKNRKYTLVFLVSDGEEYGMLGTKRFVETHSNHHNIIAGISLDNLGKQYYHGIRMSPVGQFNGYGPVWLQQVVQESSRQGGVEWIPAMKSVIEQMLDQAVPISFMDQGPLVAAGIPAVGFAGAYPDSSKQDVWATYHSERDSITYQSAFTLDQSGKAAEATVRGLMTLDRFPGENIPYLFFLDDNTIIQGMYLKLILIGLVFLFFIATRIQLNKIRDFSVRMWKGAVISFLSIWIPLLMGILELYLFVKIGLMDEYHLYPATSKDPEIYSPKWIAVILFLFTVGILFWLGNRWIKKRSYPCSADHLRALALVIISMGILIVFIKNPFSVILLLPLYFWIFIRHGSTAYRWMNPILFILGGLFIYMLIGYFGFVIMQNNLAILWYLMMMFSCRMIGFKTAVVITMILASGVMLLKTPAVVKIK